MRAPRRALAWATTAAFLCGTSAALAAEPGPDTLPINVIAIQTPDADDQAEALTKALRTAVRGMPGWSLGEGDYSFEVLTLSLKCPEPPDANCQSRVADQIKADRYVWGTLKKKGKATKMVSGELHLWVRGKGTSAWPIEYSSNLTDQNDDSLRRIAIEAIDKLTGGPPKGPLKVHAGGVAGQVFIDGQPVGALKSGEGTFMAPSGPHKVTVKAVGYADYEAQVVIRPKGAPTELSATLVQSSGGSKLNAKRIGGFAALGAGVAMGVVGLISAVQVNSAQGALNPDLTGQPDSFDICDSSTYGKHTPPLAASVYDQKYAGACGKGKTFQTLQIAMFPLAAVAGGVGIFLIATSGKSPPKTGWTVQPNVGLSGGTVDFTYKF
jgi:hypothetical protein